MKSKIKFRLVKFEKALAFQILEMDERFRRVKGTKEYICKNEWTIRSIESPELRFEKIYLRGMNAFDDFSICRSSFGSNTERDKAYFQIVEALKDWAENWDGWKEKDTVAAFVDTDIFEF